MQDDMNDSTPRRQIGPIIAIAIAILGCGAIVLWKTGMFGLAGSGAPQAANGHTPDASHDSTAARDRSLQKLDEALNAVSTYMQTDQIGKAEVVLDALTESYPDHPNVYRSLFELRLHQERHPDAYAAIRKVLDLDSTNAEEHFNAGVLASMLKKIEPAATHFEMATSLAPRNPKFPLYLAQMHIKLHEYDKAKVRLLQVINLDGSLHEAFGTLAEIAMIENDLEMAEQHISRARQIAPDIIKWRMVEAAMLRRSGQPEQSLALINALNEEHGRFRQDVVEEAARCWAMLGEPEKAAREFERQLEKHPDAWKSAVRAAEYYLIADNVEKARTWCTYASGQAPQAEEVQRLEKRIAAKTASSDQ